MTRIDTTAGWDAIATLWTPAELAARFRELGMRDSGTVSKIHTTRYARKV